MVARIAAAEFRYLLRSPMMIVVFAIFFLLPFFAMVSDNVQIGGGGNVLINSPYAIMQTLLIMTVFSVFAAPSFIGNAVLRDMDYRMDGIVFATPITKRDYLLGRFVGAYLGLALSLTSIPLGMLIGSLWPGIDPETLGPIRLDHYAFVYLVHVMPALFLVSAIFFALAVLSRSIMVTYLGAMGFLMLFFVGLQLLSGPDYRELTALLDPFGLNALAYETQYWAAFERNEQLFGWTGLMLTNRLIWLGASLLLVGLAYWRFSFRKPAKLGKRKGPGETAAPATQIALPKATPQAGAGPVRAMLARRVHFEVRQVIRSLPFLIIVGFSAFLAVSAMIGQDLLYGISPYPVTRLMVEAVQGGFALALIVVLIFYGGDLVWKDRTAGMSGILGATPTPNWVFVTAKLAGLAVVLAGIMLTAVVMAVLVQLFSGFTAIEPDMYVRFVLLRFLAPFLLIAVLSVFVQVLVPNRFLGMMIMAMFLIATIVLSQLGFEHPLYLFARSTSWPLSDMNDIGRFATADNWLLFYWACVSALLLVLVYLLWSRGELQPLRLRMRRLRDLARPVYAGVAAAAVIGWIGSGAFIFYNINILNEYATSDDLEDRAVRYEQLFRQYEDLPMPKTVSVKAAVDLYPYRRRIEVAAEQVLENKTGEALDTVHLVFPDMERLDFALQGAEVAKVNDEFEYYILTLTEPMQPGEQRRLTYSGLIQQRGFKHAREDVTLVRNGTFINNADIAPHIGFFPGGMLQDRNTRRRKGLEPLPRLPKLEDQSQWTSHYIRGDSDFIDFETTVSTAGDQIAIAPGYLTRQWQEDGRNHFRYEMDAPILNTYSYLSARYEVVREDWNGVAIEVYHHAPHTYNVARMVESVKDSIATFSEAFSPYQHQQMRIIEFPAYRRFAQAFPNTVPYSESIGFIADLTDADAIDIAYYVTAHEVAHQWWAHQVMAANTQGGEFLIETMAQYGALLVMEQEYGPDQVRKFLKYELDSYLRGRAGDPEGEQPLYRVENQAYIHYRKGAVVMYALKDYLGEQVVNRALARLVDLRGFSGEPYARSVDFIRLLREEAGPEHDQLITDLLEKITLFDLKVTDAQAEQMEDGRWRVRMRVEADKVYADAEGRETEAQLDLPLDVGVFAADPDDSGFGAEDVILMQKRDVADGESVIELIVDREPAYVGLDPYNKMIDRDSDDNLKRVNVTTLASAD